MPDHPPLASLSPVGIKIAGYGSRTLLDTWTAADAFQLTPYRTSSSVSAVYRPPGLSSDIALLHIRIAGSDLDRQRSWLYPRWGLRSPGDRHDPSGYEGESSHDQGSGSHAVDVSLKPQDVQG